VPENLTSLSLYSLFFFDKLRLSAILNKNIHNAILDILKGMGGGNVIFLEVMERSLVET
jgi:hypothetical protein